MLGAGLEALGHTASLHGQKGNRAASDTGASGASDLAPMEGDGTWKGEMLREEDKACGSTRAQVCTIHVCFFLTVPTTLQSCRGQDRDG